MNGGSDALFMISLGISMPLKLGLTGNRPVIVRFGGLGVSRLLSLQNRQLQVIVKVDQTQVLTLARFPTQVSGAPLLPLVAGIS